MGVDVVTSMRPARRHLEEASVVGRIEAPTNYVHLTSNRPWQVLRVL